MLGTSLHLLGDQSRARHHMERVLEEYVISDRRSCFSRFPYDLIVAACVYLSRTLWLLGFPDQAVGTAERAIDRALSVNHETSLCHALARAACPIARLIGDLDAAEHYTSMLLDHSRRHGLAWWHTVGRIHQGLLAIMRGDTARGSELLRAIPNQIGDARYLERWVAFPDTRVEVFAQDGQTRAAVAGVTATIKELEQNEELWLLPELLRTEGELLLLHDASREAETAESCFLRALHWARRQGALSLELRAATSLARLLLAQARPGEAGALLRRVYDRFTEGFDTSDLKAAKALLHVIRGETEPSDPALSRLHLRPLTAVALELVGRDHTHRTL